MLDKLVESKDSGKENKRLSGFFMTTFMTMGLILTFGLIYSLFSQTLTMGSGDLDVSSLIAPVAIQEVPQPEIQIKPQTSEKSSDQITTRVIEMQRTDESPNKVPDIVSVAANKYQARPKTYYTLGATDSNPAPTASGIRESIGDGNTRGLVNTVKPTEVSEKIEIEKPPVIKPVVKPTVEKVERIVSGGVVNGKASNLVKPIYSGAARTMRVDGEVRVQVTIDEDGRVISANAVSGHPLLRASAENAAKSSKFTPTTLSNQKVKVTGVIIYNFAVQ